MVNLHCFAAWAPDESPWSPWVKPILFAQMPDVAPPADADPSASTPAAAPAATPEEVGNTPVGPPIPALPPAPPQPLRVSTALEVPGLPTSSGREALILDLPGEETMDLALDLAGRGFRPVPLFNGTSGPFPVVDVDRVSRALQRGANALRRSTLRPDAPPVFLLDSLRGGSSLTVAPGRYDNRWIVLPQDAPSGTFLASRGISHVTLVQRGGQQPAQDLAHVLRRWQEQGLTLSVVDLDSRQVAQDVKVPRPSMFRATWYAVIALAGLRRHNMGGFGAPIPQQVAQSGWYA